MMPQDLTLKYDAAAATWGDKMRALGYFDAYRGFLAETGRAMRPGSRVIDIGAGTAAFAEAWCAAHGLDRPITLLEPSRPMLDRGAARLATLGAEVTTVDQPLEAFSPAAGFNALLAAHVIEHGPDPVRMLRQMRALAAPDARLWLVVSKPHWCNAIIWLQWRHQSFAPATVRALLAQTGWQLTAEHAFPAGPPSRTSRGYACVAA